MPRIWQLQEAKNRLSEVVDEALAHGPQMITRHGKETAVVLAYEDYNKITRPVNSLADFFRASPLNGLNLDLTRSRETGRKVDL